MFRLNSLFIVPLMAVIIYCFLDPAIADESKEISTPDKSSTEIVEKTVKNPMSWYTSLSGEWIRDNFYTISDTYGNLVKHRSNDTRLAAKAGLDYKLFSSGGFNSEISYRLGINWEGINRSWGRFSDKGRGYDYFPMHPGYSKRQHRFQGRISYEISSILSLGLLGRYQRVYGGSSFFKSSNQLHRSRYLAGQSILLEPSIAVNYPSHHQTRFFLYFKKDVDNDRPQRSMKTYDEFKTTSLNNLPGFGLDQHIDLAPLRLFGRIYRYDFTYNDYWDDYLREGLFIHAEYLFKAATLHALLGITRDRYEQKEIGSGCSSQYDFNDNPYPECSRSDRGYNIRLGYEYLYRDDVKFSIIYNHLANQNSAIKRVESIQNQFLIGLTYSPNNFYGTDSFREYPSDLGVSDKTHMTY